jgi:predicted transcriptional regulator of viral defense system
MIEQIPRQIFVASLDRPRRIETPIATYSVHHLAPEVFGGYTGTDATGYLASPEKALFDTVYVRSTRSGTIHLPELELPEDFNDEEVREWTERIPSARLKTIVDRELGKLIERAEQ